MNISSFSTKSGCLLVLYDHASLLPKPHPSQSAAPSQISWAQVNWSHQPTIVHFCSWKFFANGQFKRSDTWVCPSKDAKFDCFQERGACTQEFIVHNNEQCCNLIGQYHILGTYTYTDNHSERPKLTNGECGCNCEICQTCQELGLVSGDTVRIHSLKVTNLKKRLMG